MVSAGTKRKRRERDNKVAAAIEEARAQAEQERRALGTAVDASAPDSALFQEDRKKEASSSARPALTAAERRAAKRSRRALPTQRRCEAAAALASTAGVERALPPPPRKNKLAVPSTDEQILARRPEKLRRQKTSVAAAMRMMVNAAGTADDAPGGQQQGQQQEQKHGQQEEDWTSDMEREADEDSGQGGLGDEDRKLKGRVVVAATKFRAGREDLWSGKVAKAVVSEVTDARRTLVRKMNGRLRRAPAVLVPDAGLSVNPTYEQHQDQLGEALGAIYAQEEEERLIDEKLSFDPKLLEESREGEVGDTGMKDDADDEEEEEEEEAEGEGGMPFVSGRPVPERKTRAQRNKEARKRAMAANVKRKATAARQQADLGNLEAVDAAAEREFDKVSGAQKRRRLAAMPSRPRPADKPVMKMVANQRVRNEHAATRVPLSEDLAGNMRSVRTPAANPVLRDRFLSFERRGMVEPPSVIPKEVWRLNKEKAADELRDKRRRKGRGANSDLTFWKQGKRSIR